MFRRCYFVAITGELSRHSSDYSVRLGVLMKDIISEEGFLFSGDREKQARDREKERKIRIYGTPEFWLAYRIYMRSPEWRKLCRLVKERAGNLCERRGPEEIHIGRPSVHHLTYDRFKEEKLTDLQLLCDHHHEVADREREREMREAYLQAGEEAMDAAGMNTYFTGIHGGDWMNYFGSDIARAYDEWEEWKQCKAEEKGYDDYY
jgi:hypothetical protein